VIIETFSDIFGYGRRGRLLIGVFYPLKTWSKNENVFDIGDTPVIPFRKVIFFSFCLPIHFITGRWS